MFDTDDDIVDTGATENTATEVETAQTPPEQQIDVPELTDEEKAQKEAEQEGEKKRNRAQERIQQLARERAEYKRELEELKAKEKAKGDSTKQDSAPQIEEFEDYSEFQKAQQEWYLKQAEERILARLENEKSQQTKVQKEAEFQTALIEASSELPDFDHVVQAGLSRNLPMPITLDEVAAEFGYDAKIQTRLLYELAKDEEFHEQVSSASKLKAARLLSEKADSFSVLTPVSAPKIPNTPKPIKPTSANAPVARNPAAMSDDEWYRAEQLKRKGK